MARLSCLLLLVVLLLQACSHQSQKVTELPPISPAVQAKIDEARVLHGKGQNKMAIAKLSDLHDDQLSETEKAVKYNLKGVILFVQSEWEKALANFEVARKYVPSGSSLEGQVWLNIASCHYKQGLHAELKSDLDKINRHHLNAAEMKKYAQLKLAWAIKYSKDYEVVQSSLWLLNDVQTLAAVQDSPLKDRLNVSFRSLSDSEKVKLLEEFNSSKSPAVAYLAQIEAESRYFKGDNSGAIDVLEWLKDGFRHDSQVMSFVEDFGHRIANAAKISMKGIGVILPLSGEKQSFGQKALLGIDAALKSLDIDQSMAIHSKDSVDSPSLGAQAVRELIVEHKVPLIIGGLFPESAKAEYLEAKKYGVLYVSLAPVYLPREEKNHLLIEVQGSIESQVASLITPEMLQKYGHRVGVVYPEGEGGKAYADEFWRAAVSQNVIITSLASYPRGTLDFRTPIQHFLGLKWERERSEENAIWADTYSQERSSIRRIQTLPPALDFDWVFVASYPHEALSLIPTFGYYDAQNITLFGGPSWASRTLLNEQKNLGRLHFVGEDPNDINLDFVNKFKEIYGKPPTLIETLAFDALKLTSGLLKDTSLSDRQDFDALLRKSEKLSGLVSNWTLTDGLWLKKMHPLVMSRGEIHKIFQLQ